LAPAESGTAEKQAPSRLKSLLEGISEHDASQLATFYDATSRWVYGLVLRILGDSGAAEEVTLDVYHQVWRNAGSYDPKRGSPSAWLSTLARSRALDRLRSGAYRRRREEALVEGFDAAWQGPRPDAANLAEERRSHVLAAISSLPPEQKRAIELGFFQGLSHSEIAERLDEPIGTIKTRIRLGMRKLKNLLKPYEDFS
jgi:RNA polymerase sigma-70 factor (ECF subfamily)